jgi:hypothetical protein
MRHLPGQAALRLWVFAHRLLTLLLTLLVLAGAGVGWLSWRLSQGPLEITWLIAPLEAAAQREERGINVDIGSASLAWTGFHAGVDRPLEIRLDRITGADARGVRVFSVPRAELSLSIRSLLLGRLEPRFIALYQPRLRVERTAAGTFSIDFAAPADAPTSGPAATGTAGATEPGLLTTLLEELAQPAATDRLSARSGHLAQLRRVLVREADVTVLDRRLGTVWHATGAEIELQRLAQGGIAAAATVELGMGSERARLTLRATSGAEGARIDLASTPLSPAAILRLAPGLAATQFAPLAMLDAPMAMATRMDFGRDWAPRETALRATFDPGLLHFGPQSVFLAGGALDLATTPNSLTLRALRLEVRPNPDGPASRIMLTGQARREGEGWLAGGTLALDRFRFADLPVLWPEGVGGGARPWVTKNVTAGIGRDVKITLALAADRTWNDLVLTEVSGGLEAEDLTIHWLRPIPPFERARARLTLLSPDALEITTEGGRQRLDSGRGEHLSAITLGAGRFAVTGLSGAEQFGQIETELSGPIADVLALLRHSRLRLLDRSPLPLRDAGGQLAGRISVGLALLDNIGMEAIAIAAKARLDNVRLPGIVAGHDLEQGTLELETGNDGLKISGRATVGGIAAQLNTDMDFRSGPPGQIIYRVSANGRAEARQLAAFGLDTAGFAAGPLGLQVAYSQRRDGQAELRLGADLRQAELAFAPLAWRKAPGVAANGEARLRIARERIVAVEDIALTGDGLGLRGRLELAEGRIGLVQIDRLHLGRTQAQGSIRLQPPGAGGQPGRMNITLSGEMIDLAPRLAQKSAEPRGAENDSAPGRPWSLNARFANAHMAHGETFSAVAATAENDGTAMTRLRVDGSANGGAFSLEVAPQAGGRSLRAQAQDAGAVLRGLDILHRMQGGQLAVTAGYDDRVRERPLTGTAEITDFRIANAPALARLLQAMTLYGLLEMAQGSGLGFSRLVAPFRMTDAALELHDARAFSPSLGITAKGRLDRLRDAIDMQGTIVPAYFFNSLLGDIPIIGRLFSPETGGGVFAATYTLRGPLNDPQVGVNPLSTITPGFLRGLFNL